MTYSNESPAKLERGIGFGGKGNGEGGGGWGEGKHSLVVLKKVSTTYGKFIFFPQKTPHFENSSWIFFQLKMLLIFFPKLSKLSFNKLLMTEVSKNLRNIFFKKKKTPILILEVRFFSNSKSFSQIFQNMTNL